MAPRRDGEALVPRRAAAYARRVAPFIGRTERRVVLAILVTALVPLVATMGYAGLVVRGVSEAAFQPEFDGYLDRALGVYADLVKAMKSSMRNEAEAIATRHELQLAAQRALGGSAADRQALAAEVGTVLAQHSNVVSVTIESPDGERLGEQQREAPVDAKTERSFTVQRSIGAEDGPQLTLVFAADRSRLDELEDMQQFAQLHREFANEHRGQYVDRPFVQAFAVLLGLTVLLAVIVGILGVRPVTRRINRMAAATRPVAEGDLTVRVDAAGRDEIADLARAFNHMLETMDRSRARIEFLNRIAEWQQMARRLAHEIKNPLTPIQLAVEECHRRYPGEDAGYQQLLRTTVDIVVEEVTGLRRLVGEFAEFARLPRAQLELGDFGAYLREQLGRMERAELDEALQGAARAVELRVELPASELRVAFDREMLYRALVNLVVNAAQAIVGASETTAAVAGVVRLRAQRLGDQVQVDIEDDGPGIDPALGPKVFDAYRTTKKEGTGLGLTIVKKIVMEHGGQIDVSSSELGGARFRMVLPLSGTADSEAALAQSEAALVSG
jgi:two-component system nitrogen regulation sensor histidine kinase NtrY